MATSLKHAKMADEDSRQQGLVDNLDELVIDNMFMPEMEESKEPETFNIIFKLVKKRNGRVWLDNCCDGVKNPKTGKKERIWLLNGASSIWDSDLQDVLKDKNRYERARRGMDIPFVGGVCMVRSDNELKLEFLERHTDNVGKNKGRAGKYSFYKYDPHQEQQDRHARQLLKIELVIKAKEMQIEEVKQLASFFGVAFVDELGMKISDEGLRTALMIKADNDPVTFQKHLNSAEVKVQYLVRRGIVEAKIDLGGESGNAVWANGKGFIAKIPSTRKPLEYLTELAMTNSDEGRKFKEKLQTIVT